MNTRERAPTLAPWLDRLLFVFVEYQPGESESTSRGEKEILNKRKRGNEQKSKFCYPKKNESEMVKGREIHRQGASVEDF